MWGDPRKRKEKRRGRQRSWERTRLKQGLGRYWPRHAPPHTPTDALLAGISPNGPEKGDPQRRAAQPLRPFLSGSASSRLCRGSMCQKIVGVGEEGAAVTFSCQGEWKVNQGGGSPWGLGKVICPPCQASRGFHAEEQLCEVKCYESLSIRSPAVESLSVELWGRQVPLHFVWQKWCL